METTNLNSTGGEMTANFKLYCSGSTKKWSEIIVDVLDSAQIYEKIHLEIVAKNNDETEIGFYIKGLLVDICKFCYEIGREHNETLLGVFHLHSTVKEIYNEA